MSESKKARKVLTNKRGRDSMKRSANKTNKEKTKMLDKIKNIHQKLSTFKVYKWTALLLRTANRVGQMIVPAGVGGYLWVNYDDVIVLAIGSALIVYSVLRIANSAYLAEVAPRKHK